jgi:hypothetical protein
LQIICLLICLSIAAGHIASAETPLQTQWFETESPHFRIVYKPGHAHLVHHILSSSERALERLSQLFRYTPTEKIVINTYDVNDYGAGSATTVPRNYIWLDLAPLEPGYENIPYNERIQWLMNHELVHVVVNDLATNVEAFSRSIFSKVAPEQVQPLSILYSVLTNYSRYTPRWHQEGIAVFLETWLSGGFGRTLGSFNEMYFRSLVVEGKPFPSDIILETQLSHNSFLVETVYYLFGERFVTHLVLRHGPEKVLQWYTASASDVYKSFKQKFEDVFGLPFEAAWDEFIKAEESFQRENLARLGAAPLTPVVQLASKPIGAVAHPQASVTGDTLYWCEHRPHHLADIRRFIRSSAEWDEISTLPTPSMHQVASSAFDPVAGKLFYTTKNNQLYRDLWMLDVKSGERRILFENARVGHLTVSPATHELWGIRHSGGAAWLVYSPFPYDSLVQLVYFDIGDEVHGLAVDPSGATLAAVLHKANGDQSIIAVSTDAVKKGARTTYALITDRGSPENPSWSRDGRTLYWNAYTNGVSNIYKTRLDSLKIIPVTHTLVGLFKPVELNPDTLFAFEFSTEGFVPVLIANRQAQYLPAIRYLGQQVNDTYPLVQSWIVAKDTQNLTLAPVLQDEYNGFDHLKVVSFMPVITGFQFKKVLGIFAHVSDPILNHDVIVETGLSPFGEKGQPLDFHFKFKYEYKKEWEVGWEFNGSDFYDLFNSRKRGMLGSKLRFGNTTYWIYDNPHKLKQQSEVTFYTGVQFINDNLVRVSTPDFLVAQTALTSQSLRRTIGSSDYESGNEYTITTMFFGSNPSSPQTGFQVYAEWDRFTPYLIPHNVFHFKIAAGYHDAHTRLRQSRFFFGGFGNRTLENVDAKQFRKVFRFPGIPIYSLAVDRFAKVMIENNFPPLRFGDVSLGQHFMNHLDASLFANVLVTNTNRWFGVSVGAQANIVFKHWFNLESTLSLGVARAWFHNVPSSDWFLSFKLLRNN